MPNSATPSHTDLTTITGSGDRRLHRWVDLLAALLSRRFPASFLELAQDVPEYQRQLEEAARLDDESRATAFESIKRAFERDKKELRALGIPIESVPGTSDADDGSTVTLYRLKQTDFYLPYLSVVAPSGARTTPKRVLLDGYRALRDLDFEPDELAAVVQAAASIRSLGDTVLRADVESALRKLAVDLPIDDAFDAPDQPRVIAERLQPDAAVFAALSDALAHRKAVRFDYHSMTADRTASREVNPYGLYFTSGHWYLVGEDREQQVLRNFRVRRIEKVALLNTKLAATDFDVPAGFSLRAHARTRQSWELGDDAPMDVVVSFSGDSGATIAAAALGRAVDGAPTQRQFEVRRPDVFARWILSFAGEATSITPAELGQAVHDLAKASRAVYDSDPNHDAQPSERMASPTPARRPWDAKTAAAKLKRLLLVLPEIADGEEHSKAEVAARVGCDEKTLVDDLHSLAARMDVPGGFVDKVSISITGTTVSAESRHLRRPMRLTMSELCALDLGLAVLRTQRPPDEHVVLDRARRRLRAVIVQLSDDPIPDALYSVSLGEMGSVTMLAEVRDATRQRRKIRIGYRKSGSTITGQRVICPYTLLYARGMMYLVAYCDSSADMRIFRMDRVATVEPVTETFEVGEYDVEQIARDGRVFMGGDYDTMLVRYSPRIARWIADREQRALADDGSLVLDHPLADVEWAVRHVLQYGPDAEVLSPPSLRVRICETLDAMLH